MVPGSRRAKRVGRYIVLRRLAAGGMGTVYLARQLGAAGFARTVAIKFLHPHLAAMPEFVRRFLDEARLAARIDHPNVVATIDVVEEGEELFIVMDYVRGESLAHLVRLAAEANEAVPVGIALRIVVDALRGLHAAHTATGEGGTALGIVHRDVSPQNVIVGTDGAAHLLDFGIAKAAGKIQTTTEGQLKGKLRYMAPEQIADREATPLSDIYSAAVVLWELLAGRRLFEAANEVALMAKVLEGAVLPPSHFRDLGPTSRALDALVLRGLDRNPAERPTSAEALANDLEAAGPIASLAETAAWIERLAGDLIRSHEEELDEHAARDGTALTVTATADALPDADDSPLTESAPEVAPVDAEARHDEPRARPRVLLGAGVIALVALVTGLALVGSRASGGAAAVTTPTPTVDEAAAANVTRAPPEPTVSAAPSSEPDRALPSALPITSASAHRPAPAARGGRAGKAGCSTPYTTDANGIRRVRRECL